MLSEKRDEKIMNVVGKLTKQLRPVTAFGNLITCDRWSGWVGPKCPNLCGLMIQSKNEFNLIIEIQLMDLFQKCFFRKINIISAMNWSDNICYQLYYFGWMISCIEKEIMMICVPNPWQIVFYAIFLPRLYCHPSNTHCLIKYFPWLNNHYYMWQTPLPHPNTVHNRWAQIPSRTTLTKQLRPPPQLKKNGKT